MVKSVRLNCPKKSLSHPPHACPLSACLVRKLLIPAIPKAHRKPCTPGNNTCSRIVIITIHIILPFADSNCFKYDCSKRKSGIGGSCGRLRLGDRCVDSSREPSEAVSSSMSEWWSERWWRLAWEEENWMAGRESRTMVIGGLSADVGGSMSRVGEG
jgi:hypothetical protein